MRKRKFLKKNWLKRALLHSLMLFSNVSFLLKQAASVDASGFVFKLAVRSFYGNRCVLSGRSKAVCSSLKLSRFAIRAAANSGYIHGLKRHSW